MRIQQVEYASSEHGWRLEPATFHPDLTLLVGVSGVGKTQILKAIRRFQRIVVDPTYRNVWGMRWRIRFLIEGRVYHWEGEYEPRSGPAHENGALTNGFSPLTPPARILRERLEEEHQTLIDRIPARLEFQGRPTPRLSPYESALSLLREEDRIRPVYEGFGRIVYMSHALNAHAGPITHLGVLCERYPSLEDIRRASLPTYVKLALVHENQPAVFHQIVESFQGIFPQVEEVRIERRTRDHYVDVPDVRIKERGSAQWIPETRISSGMFRTLMHLSSVVLWPDNSVILIDEFENSLGVNCLDEITSNLIAHSRRLQFIATSHHPYIINNIPSKHWKVVTRKGGVVSTHDADELGIGRSRHEAFLQLINSERFREGIQVG